jgi:flagellar hook-associated protein 1 FlgK
MADLFSLLVQSGNSLGAHSAALNVAGNNIANASTPGYSRQIAMFVANPGVSSTGAGSVGTGVSLQAITQARDQFVERQVPTTLAAQSRSQTESDALASLTALNPDLQGGLSSAMGEFYASLQTWSQNPGDSGLRQAVLGSSQALATSFNQTANSINDARTGLDAAMTGKVAEVNAAAQKLADLNVQIEIAGSAGGKPTDLLDQRQMAVDHLASLTGATPYVNGRGDISMALPGGMAIVSDTRAGAFSMIPDAANGGHLKLQFSRNDGSPPFDWNGSALSGTLGGLFGARDGALKTAATAVDNLAFDMGTAVNAVHQAGYAMDGTPGLALFAIPLSATGAATQIAVNAAVASNPRLLAGATTLPAGSGDNRNVLALLATQRQALAGGSDPIVSLQSLVTSYGISSAQANAMAEHDGAMASHLKTLRESVSGVSIAEELINLPKAQKAYEAVSKVIAVANEMLDTLMSLK